MSSDLKKRDLSSTTEVSPSLKRNQSIGAFFHERRMRAGLTLEMAAQALGIDDPMRLAVYEAGKETLPLEDIFALTNLLNVPPEDVLGLIYDLFGHDRE